MSNSVFLPKNSESHQNMSRQSVSSGVNSNSEPVRLKKEIDDLLNQLQKQHQSANAQTGGSVQDKHQSANAQTGGSVQEEHQSANAQTGGSVQEEHSINEPVKLKQEIDDLLNQLQKQHQSANAQTGGSSEENDHNLGQLKNDIDHLLHELQSRGQNNASAVQSGGKKSSRRGSKKSSRKGSKKSSRRGSKKSSKKLFSSEQLGGAKKSSRKSSKKSSRKGSKKSSRKGSRKSSKKMITYEQLGGVKKGSKSSKKGSKYSKKGSKSSKKLIEDIVGGASKKSSRKSSKKSSRKGSKKGSRKGSKKGSKKGSRSMKRELPLVIVKGNEFKEYIQKDMKLKGGPVLMTFSYMIWNEFKKSNLTASPDELFKGAMNLYNNYKKSGSLTKMYEQAEKRFNEKKAAKKAEKNRNLSESS